MRTPLDALLSVRRYLGEALGQGWDVRVDAEEGATRFPAATVALAGPAISQGPAHTSDVVQPLTIYLSPAAAKSPSDAMFVAAELEDLMYQAIRVGIGDGRPNRIPLFDFSEDMATRFNPADYLRVSDFSTTQVADPNDARRITLTVELRVTWRRPARRPGGDHGVKSVTIQNVGK